MIALKSNQKSYVPVTQDFEKKWLLCDVKGKILGDAASKIADLLRGKGKPFFTPQHDCGDYVVVINAKDIRLASDKIEKKLYHWHTRYPAGLRTRTAKEILTKKPEKVLYDAVFGMLPRNKLRKHIIRKLKIFPGPTHNQTAQSPQPIAL